MVINGFTADAVYFLKDIPQAFLTGVTGKVTCLLSVDGTMVMGNSYYPDDDGIVTFIGLSELIESYLELPDFSRSRNLYLQKKHTVGIICTATSSTVTLQFYILYNRYQTGMKPEELRGFLTRMSEIRTYSDRLEYISFIQRESLTVTAGVAYLQSGKARYKKVNVPISSYAGGIDSVLVSVNRIASLSGISLSVILFYDLYLDDGTIQDRIRFEVDKKHARFLTTFWYVGVFGTPESVSFTGAVTGEPEYEVETIISLVSRRNVKNELTEKFTVNSGWLTPEKYKTVEDLITSPTVYVYTDSLQGPIAISDAKMEHRFPQNEVSCVTVTYSPVALIQKFLRNREQPERIFDKTFDYTFD